MKSRRYLVWLLSTVVIIQAHSVAAQTPVPADPGASVANAQDEQKPPAAVGEEGHKETRGFFSALGHNMVDDVKHMPRRNSAYWLAGGTAMALAIHPSDGKINRRLLGKPGLDKVFIPGKYIGNTAVVLGVAGTTYLVGRHTASNRLQHLGMDLIEATIVGEGTAEIAKLIIRRDRPINPDGKQSAGYSMPSGHATVTFAAATVLQQHLGYKAAIPTYLIASYVAVSRLHDNRHYASDVVMGATTGIIVGRSVTYHGRNFWGAAPAIVPGGMALMFTKIN
jgi:membrane-associated phospholipid phosphatase